jgi:FAD/FMN-containing dehydrogenase
LQRGERAVEAMRAIKGALDPNGLLNPGKVL